ncbi:hypothetical protein C6P45_000356 [Maudiozyma exigua]|uniref:Uncharacterized protein n=1 Tax=Maudiozyma exigua TaxID=34358 RepID=A0A9P6WDX5_MAUEX|nr:hypothetical protein C6P45_000356 [Kazachstania exigua]
MAAHTDMIFTPQDSNLLNTWGRHASSSLNTELSNLQVDNEINSIRNKLSYRELVQDMTVMKCEDPVVVCNFKELLYSSDVVLLVHSKLESSNYVQRQLELLFEIYPGLLIVDFDTSEQGIQLFGYVTDLFNVRNDLPFLFINGQLVPSDTLYSMLKDTSKHFDLLCKLKQFGKDNVKIKRKIVPSNI